jgi:hypothetical protein
VNRLRAHWPACLEPAEEYETALSSLFIRLRQLGRSLGPWVDQHPILRKTTDPERVRSEPGPIDTSAKTRYLPTHSVLPLWLCACVAKTFPRAPPRPWVPIVAPCPSRSLLEIRGVLGVRHRHRALPRSASASPSAGQTKPALLPWQQNALQRQSLPVRCHCCGIAAGGFCCSPP